MWERFTEKAKEVIFHGMEIVRSRGGGDVAPEHLLLGLLADEDTVARQMLNELEVPHELLKSSVESLLQGSPLKDQYDLGLTPDAKEVINRAYDVARELDNNYIGTEHLLLGLTRLRGRASGLTLAKFASSEDLEMAREIVVNRSKQDASGT